MRAVLFDASIYIAVLRSRADASLALSEIAGGETVWLSSVVLEELYAGANPRNLHVVETLALNHNHAKRTLVPNLSDWIQAGKLLAGLAAKYDYEQIGRGRLTNDALIAVSAGRRGITVIAANAKDFARLAEFCRFRWRLSQLPAN